MKMKAIQVVRLLPLLATALAGAQSGISNPGFESGSVGKPPPDWFVHPMVTSAGYVVETSSEGAKEGKQCVFIALGARKGEGFGNMFQSIDATPYRGKRVRFRAAVRYDRGNEFGRAQLWMRVDRTGGAQGFFNNMGDRPITSASWGFYEIVGDVASDAETLNVGMMLVGGGRAWIDAATVGIAAPAVPVAKPKAFEGRGLENLTAFTKLLGYIRHFHPSDAVEKADWNGFAMAGVTAVEDAQSPTDLAQKLETFFKPLAPTVRVFPTGKAPADPIKFGSGGQLVTWENIGFGGGNIPAGQNIYRSKRTYTSGTAVKPETVLKVDLGGGVSAEVPTVLLVASNATVPKTAEPTVPKGVRDTPTGDDRTTRLAAVALGWNVFEHFYPYFDEVKADWPATLTTALNSAATDPSERAFLDTLRKMVGAAQDGHGHVVHTSDTSFAQPPILADWVEGKFVVTQVGSGVSSPRAGDEILQIDGKPVEALWAEEEAKISGATPQWRRSRGRSVLLAGPDGSTVALQVRTGTAAPTNVSLKRTVGGAPKEKRPKAIEEVKVGIWYVDLDGGRANMDEYKKALRDLTAAEGVIFDMRGYPNEVAMDVLRRAASEPITSANWNVPIVSKPDHQGMTFNKSRWNPAPPEVPRFRGKVVFITDGRAISYAESVMGIVENYKLGAIVGEPTAGTNGNINPFNLPGGYTIIFTGMKVTKHDGTVHHGVGIKPTVPVSRTIAGVAAGKDELLEKAIAVVRGQ